MKKDLGKIGQCHVLHVKIQGVQERREIQSSKYKSVIGQQVRNNGKMQMRKLSQQINKSLLCLQLYSIQVYTKHLPLKLQIKVFTNYIKIFEFMELYTKFLWSIIASLEVEDLGHVESLLKLTQQFNQRLFLPISPLAPIRSSKTLQILKSFNSATLIHLPFLIGYLSCSPTVEEEFLSNIFLKAHYKHFLRFSQQAQGITIPSLLINDASQAIVNIIQQKNTKSEYWVQHENMTFDQMCKAIRKINYKVRYEFVEQEILPQIYSEISQIKREAPNAPQSAWKPHKKPINLCEKAIEELIEYAV